jgi:hypothetical protein
MTILQLDSFSSDSWYKRELRNAGTYTKIGEVRSAAMLSSVFVESMDVGATLKVNFFDATTGADVGERYNLKSHDLISAVGSYRILVTRHHNRVGCEAIVTGGNVKFSVYITALPSPDLIDFVGVNDDGQNAIRTSSDIVGINSGGVVSEVTLNSSTWTNLTPSPLIGRKAMSIQNNSNTEIKINYSNSPAGYIGMSVPSKGGERVYNVSDNIIIYGKSASGSVIVNVEQAG